MRGGGQMPSWVTGMSEASDAPDGDRRKVRGPERQARMVYPYYPGIYPMNQGMVFPMNQLPPLPPPRVTRDSVLFQLLPNRNDLQFMFDIGISGQKVYLISSVSVCSFWINQHQFLDKKLPCEISKSVVNGTNYIAFAQNTTGMDIIVELKLNIDGEIDNLVNHIVEKLPKATPRQVDPFVTSTCPISGQKIVTAARGHSCDHTQCFDLRGFIIRSIDTGNFACPICGQINDFVDLRHDPTYLLQIVSADDTMFEMFEMN